MIAATFIAFPPCGLSGSLPEFRARRPPESERPQMRDATEDDEWRSLIARQKPVDEVEASHYRLGSIAEPMMADRAAKR